MNPERIQEKAGRFGLVLEAAQLEQLMQYAALLAEWNSRISLTAIREEEAVEDKHFVDSLFWASRPEVSGQVADVGSGAGFPGLVAKILKPGLALTLFEPVGKKAKFLRLVAETIGLEVQVSTQRAEDAARGPQRDSFDCVTARGVALLPTLCEYCLPLVRPGGWFVPLKGESGPEELALAAHALAELNAKPGEPLAYNLPDGDARTLLFIQKTGPTPAAYPRVNAKIKKKPL